jgi:hypothetical protein
VNAPPITGPTTEEIKNTAPMKLWYKGLLRSGMICTVNTILPEKIPAEPRPAKARPTMKVEEFCETPQMRDPSSKMETLVRKTHLGE